MFRPFGCLVLCVVALLAIPSPAHAQDVEYELERAEPKGVRIESLKLLAWQDGHKKKYAEAIGFREQRQMHLAPSDKFDVACQVVGGQDVLTNDYVLWTTVDFLVAPVAPQFGRMDNDKLSSSVGWGQIAEMRDLKAIPIYDLRPDEERQVLVKELDLSAVLASFPVGNAGNLWPWLLRITVHVQDRSGKQRAVAQKTLQLSPNLVRGHYNEPLPTR